METQMTETRWRKRARWLLALFMVGIGVGHFLDTGAFAAMVPAWLPSPELLVRVSGACEIAGGIGLLLPPFERAAAFGLILLYIAVFPANVNMALHHLSPPGMNLSPALLWARLPFQALFIAWAWWLARARDPRPS